MHKQPVKKAKSGINQPIICKNCGKRVGFVRVKSSLKWRNIRWMLAIGLVLEFIANLIVYLIFK